MQFRKDINGLRALAVVCVVLFHYRVPGFSGGFVGVDVFFVISGFLMAYAVLPKVSAGTFSAVGFYGARARRILPALTTLCVVLMTYGYLRFLPAEFEDLSKSAAGALTFTSNFVFWREQGYFDTPSQQKILLHTWSLSVEWQFYLLFPLLILVLRRLFGGRFVLPGVALVALTSLALSIVMTPWKPEAAFFLLPTRAWELLAGTLLYLAGDRRRVPFGSVLGVAMIAAATYLYHEGLMFPGAYALLPVLGATLILAERGHSKLLENPVSQFLGNTSYSIYLMHWPVLLLFQRQQVDPLSPPSPLSLVVLIILSVALGYLSYRFVETPLRKLGRSWSKARTLCVHLGGAAVVALLAFSAHRAHGIPQRLTARARQIDATRNDDGNPLACNFVDDICALGKVQPRKVLIWGDSHGEHLYPVLQTLTDEAEKNGAQILLAVKHGCLPVRRMERGERPLGCVEANEALFQRALADDVDRVIITSIWMNYFRSRPTDSSTKPTVCFMRGESCEPLPEMRTALDLVEQQLDADVAELIKRGKSVHIMLPLPLQLTPVPETLARAAWLGEPPVPPLSAQAHKTMREPVFRMLQRVAKRTGAQLVDPASVFCTDSVCPYEVDGLPIYRDNNHLTSAGVVRLRPMLRQLLSGPAGTP